MKRREVNYSRREPSFTCIGGRRINPGNQARIKYRVRTDSKILVYIAYVCFTREGKNLLGSGEVEKYRYDKSVYVGVVGNCAACYYCLYACPENAIKDTKPPTIDDARCTRCMKCVEACPRNVMQIIRY